MLSRLEIEWIFLSLIKNKQTLAKIVLNVEKLEALSLRSGRR